MSVTLALDKVRVGVIAISEVGVAVVAIKRVACILQGAGVLSATA